MWSRWFRASVAIAATLALGMTALPADAATAPKPGTSCSTHKATRTVSGVKFTCIINVKKSPKYVWNKGVKVVAAPTPTKPPEVVLTLDNLDTSKVRTLAYLRVVDEIASAKAFTPNVVYVLGPSLTAAQSAREQKGLETTAAFWSDIYQPSSVAIAYFNAADVDVIDGLACSIAQYCQNNGGKISDMIKRDSSRGDSSCNSAFATQYSPTQQLFAQCLGPMQDDVKNRQTTPHEYTHFAQQGAFQMDSPIWFVEGSAAYFGGAIGAYVGGAGRSDLDHMIYTDSWGWRNQTLVDVSKATPAVIEQGLRRTYDRQAPDGLSLAQLSYYPGAEATEVMVALWGIPKLKHFMTQIKTLGFDNAFKAEYGVSVDEFYPAVSKYISAMYALGR